MGALPVELALTLTVVEPMMVGILGGGFAHLRRPDGGHEVLEGQSACPSAITANSFIPDPNAPPGTMDTIGRRNAVGRAAVATPGTLMAWCTLLSRHGRLALADVVEPAIRHASRGFIASQYLSECTHEAAADLALDPEIARVFLPGGQPIAAEVASTSVPSPTRGYALGGGNVPETTQSTSATYNARSVSFSGLGLLAKTPDVVDRAPSVKPPGPPPCDVPGW